MARTVADSCHPKQPVGPPVLESPYFLARKNRCPSGNACVTYGLVAPDTSVHGPATDVAPCKTPENVTLTVIPSSAIDTGPTPPTTNVPVSGSAGGASVLPAPSRATL